MLRNTLSKLRPILHNTVQRTSSPDDFFIELNHPHQTFSPGDKIDGSVVIVLTKPQKITTIVCTIEGTIMIRNTLVKTKAVKHVLFEDSVVLWGEGEDTSSNVEVSSIGDSAVASASTTSSNSSGSKPAITGDNTAPNTSTPNTSTPNTSTSSSGSSDGNSGNLNGSPGTSRLSLSSGESNTTSTVDGQQQPPQTQQLHKLRKQHRQLSSSSLSSSSSSTTLEPLPRGEHLFAFEFSLPEKGLFNSLEFERGAISYTITASCHRSGPSPVITAQKALSVICPIDITSLPPPKVSTLTVDVHKKRKGHGSIVVAVALPRKGYLRGDSVPVKVSIQHMKHVKHLSGIITTLSRISIVSAEGSEAQSFRKDLAQTISPLYTDPGTFFSTVTTNIRIPPETFPTTKGHKDVSFQYCIEVVIDLAGKWSSDITPNRDPDMGSSKLGYIDTDKLKRGRGVVNLWTEVVIGTYRSNAASNNNSSNDLADATNRKRQKGKSVATAIDNNPNTGSSSSLGGNTFPIPSRASGGSPQSTHSSTASSYQVLRYEQVAAAAAVTSEKENLRRMEEALLPSAPDVPAYPYEESESQIASVPYYHDDPPSAPVPLSRPIDINSIEAAPYYRETHPGPSELESDQLPSAPPSHLFPRPSLSSVEPSAPSYSGGSIPPHQPTPVPVTASASETPLPRLSDKAELERNRLEQIASQPDDDYVPKYEPMDSNEEPSAPILPEDLAPDNDDNDDKDDREETSAVITEIDELRI